MGDDLGAMYFEISGATFQVVSKDDAGTSETTAVTFTTGWAGADTKYRIRWEPDQIIFYVNGTVVATHSTRVPSHALAIKILNSDADNTDLEYVAVKRAASII